MNRKQKENIKNSIRMCKLRLQTIKPHLTEEKYALNESFNKLLIEKAILRDKLMRKEPSFVEKITRKFRSNKHELICDYFK
ncbi:hypothetical protein IJ182_03135 [bacterium]|nr:hypothetical protein [bacterium]